MNYLYRYKAYKSEENDNKLIFTMESATIFFLSMFGIPAIFLYLDTIISGRGRHVENNNLLKLFETTSFKYMNLVSFGIFASVTTSIYVMYQLNIKKILQIELFQEYVTFDLSNRLGKKKVLKSFSNDKILVNIEKIDNKIANVNFLTKRGEEIGSIVVEKEYYEQERIHYFLDYLRELKIKVRFYNSY